MMIPTPGTPSYLPSLLSYISSQSSTDDFSPDPVLFSAILLNLIVDRGGLIVNLPPRTSVKGKQRAVQHVSAISQGVFGRVTHLAELTEDVGPEDLGYHLLTCGPLDPPHRALEDEETHAQGDEGLRVPDTLILTGLEEVSGPTLVQLGDILVKKSIPAPSSSTSSDRRMRLPEGFLLVWIKTPSTNPSPGWWMDQFASSLTIYPSSLSRLPDIPLIRPPIIPREYIYDLRLLLDFTHIHPPLQVHISNLLSALSAHASLLPTLTGRAVRLFPLFVKAHRLLSGPFILPPDWKDALHRHTSLPDSGKSGGQGRKEEVDSWARLAGEEPTLANLTGIPEDAEDGWYASSENVNGVWSLCMRHRVRLRGKKSGGIMWMLQTSAGAAGELGSVQDDKGREVGQVDRILEKIIQSL